MLSFPKKNPAELLSFHRAYRSVRPIRLIAIAALAVIAAILALTGWFVYRHIYQTIGAAQTYGLAAASPQIKPVNFKLYEETAAAKQQKFSPSTLAAGRDPFVFASSTKP